MISETIPEIESLSPTEKLQLASELLNQVVAADSADDIPLSPETRAALDQSLEDYRRNPDQGVRWETLHKRLKSRERR